MATPPPPSSRSTPADRKKPPFDAEPTDRVSQRLQAQQEQSLDRKMREFERQQTRFEQERQRLTDSHARSVKIAEEQLARQKSQLEADQQRIRKLQSETETREQEADEKLKQAGVVAARASSGSKRGLLLLLLALPIAAGFIWYGWQSDQRQAQLERSLAILASDTGRLADELDDSSAAKAEMFGSLKSLKSEASNSDDALSRLQNENAKLSNTETVLTTALEAERSAHTATREMLASGTAAKAALDGRLTDLAGLLEETQTRLAATLEADSLRQLKDEAASAMLSDRLVSTSEALAGSTRSLETMRLRLAEMEESASAREEASSLQEEAKTELQGRFDALKTELAALRDSEAEKQALVAIQRAELQARVVELEDRLADATKPVAKETEPTATSQ